MKLKNYEIMNADTVIGSLFDQPITGALKFKLYKLKQQLEQLAMPIRKTLEELDQEKDTQEWIEIEQIEQEVEVGEPLTEEELAPLTMTLSQVNWMMPFVENKEAE